MATFTSESYDGRYLQLTISESVDVKGNKSLLNWTLSSIGGAVNYYSTGPTTVKINGTQVYYKARMSWDAKVFPAAKGSTSGSIPVAHNSDGKKSISVEFSTAIHTSAITSHGGTMTLANIDRTAPSVSLSCSSITSSSVKITVTSSTTANRWWYSTNSGSSWTEFDSTDGTKKEKIITGLSPNTTYSIQVCARKKSNDVDGYSSTVSIKTLGGSIIHSAGKVTADNASVSIVANVTSYGSSFYHKLVINNGSADILTINLETYKAGKYDRTITLTSTQRNTLLQNIKGKELNAVLYLKTYTSSAYSSQVGDTSACSCTFATTSDASAPTFTDFSYSDTRSVVADVVGDATKLLQTYSYLQVVCNTGVAKNYASIVSYSVSIGELSKTSTTTTLNVGAIAKSGSFDITVTCTDSRGWSTSVTKQIIVLPYAKPKITSYRLRRKDEVGRLIQLSFNGSISAIKADGETNTNGLKHVGYYYKRTDEDNWGRWHSLLSSTTASETTFSFKNDELLELDEDKSYDFHILIRDQLDTYSSFDLYIVMMQGTPIIALRKRNSTYNFPRVGINNPNPTESLDVAGNIKMNGSLVLGYVGEVKDNFNNYKSGGFYHYNGSGAINAPDGAGVLEVLVGTTGYLIQRFTSYESGAALYIRALANNSWTAWSNK